MKYFNELIAFSLTLALAGACAAPTGGGDDEMDDEDREADGSGGFTPGVVGAPGSGGFTAGLPGGSGGSTTSAGGSTASVGGGAGVGGNAGVGGTPPISSDYPGTLTASTVSTNGLVTSGTWSGYSFTWVGGGANPLGTADIENSGSYMCAWGTLDANENAVMGLGFNLAQSGDDANNWDMNTASGISYNVKNDGDSTVRLQITVGGTAYCVVAAQPGMSGSGTALWSDFKTACWNGSGTSPTPGMIAKADFVGAGTDAQKTYSPAFCVISVAPVPK